MKLIRVAKTLTFNRIRVWFRHGMLSKKTRAAFLKCLAEAHTAILDVPGIMRRHLNTADINFLFRRTYF